MSGTTITTLSNGVTLGMNGYTSPLTITATGTIQPGSTAYGVYAGPDITNANIDNLGLIEAGTTGLAIYVDHVGYVNNAGTLSGLTVNTGLGDIGFGGGGEFTNSGLVDGYWAVVSQNDPLQIINSGTILGSQTGVPINGGINAGVGILLTAGGYVSNYTSGLVSGLSRHCRPEQCGDD